MTGNPPQKASGAMILFALIVFIEIAASQAKLIPSTRVLHLQPGEIKTLTFQSNSSQSSNVFLRTQLLHIATVTPARQEVDPSHRQWEVQVRAHELGYTHIIAAINISNVFSFEEGLVQITVLKEHWLHTFSLVCGWIYFSAWTFSFYPQILINMRRKSVVGLNFDFVALNELGYICYSIFNCCLFYVPSIQAEYFQRHSGSTNPVLLNDVLFSVHGFFATSVMIVNVFMYERGGQTMSQTAVVLLSAGVCALICILLAAAFGFVMWLDAVVWVSFIKLMVTVIKYIPQALMNYRNKSTEGWSIGCIFCDLTGSTFSLMQMLLISYNCDDWVSILGDPTKFGLGLASIGFDLIFMVQHYILYRPKKLSNEEHTVEKLSIEEFPTEKCSNEKYSTKKCSIEESSIGKCSSEENSIEKLSISEHSNPKEEKKKFYVIIQVSLLNKFILKSGSSKR